MLVISVFETLEGIEMVLTVLNVIHRAQNAYLVPIKTVHHVIAAKLWTVLVRLSVFVMVHFTGITLWIRVGPVSLSVQYAVPTQFVQLVSQVGFLA